MRWASAASIFSPSRQWVRARAIPTRPITRGEITPATRPSRASVNAKKAVGSATTMSHAQIRPTPPPKAPPATRATTGTGARRTARNISPSSWAASRFSR